VTVFLPHITETDLKKIILSVQQLGAGRSNAVGSVTLTANAASTVVSDNNVASGSTIYLMPTTSNAAAAIATTYIATIVNKSFTITHANNAQVDKTFRYAIVG
jgi:hypothetical protein